MTEKIIEVNNLTYQYKDATSPALSNVNFTIKKGAWVSVIGHNGSGKSTLSRLMNGLLEANSGTIKIDGTTLNQKTVWDIRNKIGIVFQNPDNQFVGTTVEDDVAFGLENRNVNRSDMINRVDQVLKEVGMINFKTSEPQLLSGGQKQRVAIAGILAIKPEIIILDEATSMLDPDGRNSILKLIKDLQKKDGMTVLSITHHVEETLESDQILVLDNGKLVSDSTPHELFENYNLVEKLKLRVPFLYDLKSRLRKQGFEIPQDIHNKEEMVKYLCQLNSKM